MAGVAGAITFGHFGIFTLGVKACDIDRQFLSHKEPLKAGNQQARFASESKGISEGQSQKQNISETVS